MRVIRVPSIKEWYKTACSKESRYRGLTLIEDEEMLPRTFKVEEVEDVYPEHAQ